MSAVAMQGTNKYLLIEHCCCAACILHAAASRPHERDQQGHAEMFPVLKQDLSLSSMYISFYICTTILLYTLHAVS